MATLNTFPMVSHVTGLGGGQPVFLDPACRNRATVLSPTGAPLPGNEVTVTGETVPLFQAAAAVVYMRDATGQAVALYPHPTANPPTVTGSKGSNAALTSLMQALAGLGLVVDQTS